MKVRADDITAFTAVDDTLVLASVSSPAEEELLSDWLHRQRDEHPDSEIEVLRLPADDDPPPGVLAQLVEMLDADHDRSVVPVRVFWVPGGLPTRSKVVALISGRDTYCPPKILQHSILKRDPSRARVVAGEPAKVSELRQYWSDNTTAENPREFARFVLRRAILAIERVELRLLGPEYKSPRLIKPEVLSSARFREGLEKIPGATVEQAGEMLDELGTGWSRFSVDLIPSLGRAIFSRGFDPNIDYDRTEVEAMRHALEAHPAVLLFSHRSYLDGVIVPVAMQENRLPPVHTFAGINLSFGAMGPLMRRSGVIFLRRKLDDPLYKFVLRQFVGHRSHQADHRALGRGVDRDHAVAERGVDRGNGHDRAARLGLHVFEESLGQQHDRAHMQRHAGIEIVGRHPAYPGLHRGAGAVHDPAHRADRGTRGDGRGRDRLRIAQIDRLAHRLHAVIARYGLGSGLRTVGVDIPQRNRAADGGKRARCGKADARGTSGNHHSGLGRGKAWSVVGHRQSCHSGPRSGAHGTPLIWPPPST